LTDIDPAMLREVSTALLMAALPSGCAESQLTGSLLYMTPYKIEQTDCAELKKKSVAATARVKQMEQLRDKAASSAAGPLVNTMVYGPDYSRARWEQRLYGDEMARKSCDAQPPPGPASEAASTPQDRKPPPGTAAH